MPLKFFVTYTCTITLSLLLICPAGAGQNSAAVMTEVGLPGCHDMLKPTVNTQSSVNYFEICIHNAGGGEGGFKAETEVPDIRIYCFCVTSSNYKLKTTLRGKCTIEFIYAFIQTPPVFFCH